MNISLKFIQYFYFIILFEHITLDFFLQEII